MSANISSGESTSYDSIASTVRTCVPRRQTRPRSLADEPELPELATLADTHPYAYSGNDLIFVNEKRKNHSLIDVNDTGKKRTSSDRKDIEDLLDGRVPRRAASLTDFLFRKRNMRYNKDGVCVFVNPMNAMYEFSSEDATANENGHSETRRFERDEYC